MTGASVPALSFPCLCSELAANFHSQPFPGSSGRGVGEWTWLLRSIDYNVHLCLSICRPSTGQGLKMWTIANGMVETETIPLSSFDALPLEPTLSRWSQRSALKETARLHACCCPPFAFLHAHARFCHFIFLSHV